MFIYIILAQKGGIMIDYKLHEEIKLLTQNCYNPKTNFLPND